METFAALFEQLDQTRSINAKIAFMEKYFKAVEPEDGAWALFFLSGQRLKRFISPGNLFEWCREETCLPGWIMEEAYASVGDTAETLALLLVYEKGEVSKLSLSKWMEERILPLRDLPLEKQKERILDCWKELDEKGRFILFKILTGSLRIGVSHGLTIKALSKALNLSPEVLSLQLMGNWFPSREFFENLKKIDAIQHTHLHPYPFFLASPLTEPLESLGDPKDWVAEWKWDGIRAQGIKRGNQAAIWSRGNDLISEQFPEIISALSHLPDDTVVDGEILAFENELPLVFGELQKRLGRKNPPKSIIEKVPVVFMIYDVLEYKGNDLRQRPFKERRAVFEEWSELHPKFRVSPKIPFENWEHLEKTKSEAKARRTEGFVIKKMDSRYGVRRQRGAWWKYKVDPMTIDAVLLYAQTGQGRRANLYTDYTFGVWHEHELVPIAKAYSGLTDEEIRLLDNWIRKNTTEKFGPVRKVKPEQVFEIAFEGIQVSNRHKSGVALRFPRIARWRNDKPIEECDTLEMIKKEFLEKS